MYGFRQDTNIENETLRDHGVVCDENSVRRINSSTPVNPVLTICRVCVATGFQAQYFKLFLRSTDKTCKSEDQPLLRRSIC